MSLKEKISSTVPEGATLYRPGFFLKAYENGSNAYIDHCHVTDFLGRTLSKFLDEYYFRLLHKVDDEIYIFEQKLRARHSTHEKEKQISHRPLKTLR